MTASAHDVAAALRERLDPDAGELLPDPDVVTAWLAGAVLPTTPGTPDTRESLLARLALA